MFFFHLQDSLLQSQSTSTKVTPALAAFLPFADHGNNDNSRAERNQIISNLPLES